MAPTLLRSQVLALAYQSVRRRDLTRMDAERQLGHVRGLRIRLLGDRVSQGIGWKLAAQLALPDTFDAEYPAVTWLRADAFITFDARLADLAKDVVTIASIEALA